MSRITFLMLASLALLAALPAAATPAPASPSPAATAACAQTMGVLGLAAPAPRPARPASPSSLTLPDWLASPRAAATTVFHGYCHCTCSRIPDCNTNADCSNHRCLGGISCC